jgi:hypothetical protein
MIWVLGTKFPTNKIYPKSPTMIYIIYLLNYRLYQLVVRSWDPPKFNMFFFCDGHHLIQIGPSQNINKLN